VSRGKTVVFTINYLEFFSKEQKLPKKAGEDRFSPFSVRCYHKKWALDR
jgi:hypothetical protein